MPGPPKKMFLLAVPALLIIGMVSLYMWKLHKEQTVITIIERIPGTLKAERVQVAWFENTVEIHKLHGTVNLIAEAPFDIRIEKLTLTGIRNKLDQSSGTVKVADTIHIRYLSFDPGQNFAMLLGYSFMNVASYEIDGLWMDWHRLRQAVENGPRSDAFVDFLLSLRLGPSLALGSSVKISALPSIGDFSQNDFLITVGKAEMESYSLLRMGKTSNRDVALVYANGGRFTIREMDFHSYSAPESSLRMMVTGGLESYSVEQSRALLEEGYSLRGMTCKKALIDTGSGGRGEIPLLLFDLEIGNGKLLIHLQARDMLFSGNLLASAFSEHDTTMGKILSRPRSISADFDLRTEPGQGDSVRIVYDQELQEEELGSLTLHFALRGDPPDGPAHVLPVNPESLLFEKGELEIADKDFLRQYFEAAGMASGGKEDPEKAVSLREEAVKQLRRDAARQKLSAGDSLGPLADFLEKSGHYLLKLRSLQPVSVYRLTSLIGNQEYLRLEAEHRQ